MIHLVLNEFATSLPTQGRLMCWDVGSKTIGIAISDGRRVIASPLTTLHRRQWKVDGPLLLAMMDTHQIQGLVVGWPLHFHGDEGTRTQSVRQVAENFLQLRDIPLFFWDERMSTMAVTRVLIEADMSRKKRAKVVDQLAAVYILQGALDALSSRVVL
jgi:putative Holliday junction resolvase